MKLKIKDLHDLAETQNYFPILFYRLLILIDAWIKSKM